jgi:hypothetical protein
MTPSSPDSCRRKGWRSGGVCTGHSGGEHSGRSGGVRSERGAGARPERGSGALIRVPEPGWATDAKRAMPAASQR